MAKLVPLFLLILVTACGKSSKSGGSAGFSQDVSTYFSGKEVQVQVFYEEGAAPYVDGIGEFKTWNILEKNLQALLDGRTSPPQVVVPKELTKMTKLVSQERVQWSINQVLELDKITALPSKPGVNTFNVYFLKGRAKEDADIIGYHITGTKVIAIFKEVVLQAAAGTNELVPRYVEQSTLVHEMGHALGLVNNGLPLMSAHQEHGAHCSNPDCVMYYANEGMGSMMKFATKVAADLSVIMFDQQCLNDARAFKK